MKIVIVGAMDKELDNYLNIFSMNKVSSLVDIYTANYLEHIIYVVKCGIGKVNSSYMTQYIIDNFKPDLIINSGCCGALKGEINLLDFVLADSLCYHDFYPQRICDVATFGNNLIMVNKDLLNIARKVVENKNVNLHIGKIASGDNFVTDIKTKEDIYKRTHALAVDMESASIAQVCKVSNIPFLIIRVVSDNCDGIDDFEKEASDLSSLIVKEVIDNL